MSAARLSHIQVLYCYELYLIVSFPSATFNVQKFRIEEINDTVLLICAFAENSFADGCRVHFVQNATVTIKHFIPKQVNEDIVSTDVIIPNGDYTVLVYDVINGQPISISPACATTYSVTRPNTPSAAIPKTGIVLKLCIAILATFLISLILL